MLANSIIIRIKELLLQLRYIKQTEAFYTGAERINSSETATFKLIAQKKDALNPMTVQHICWAYSLISAISLLSPASGIRRSSNQKFISFILQVI